jgi:hypothetical protein
MIKRFQSRFDKSKSSFAHSDPNPFETRENRTRKLGPNSDTACALILSLIHIQAIQAPSLEYIILRGAVAELKRTKIFTGMKILE